MYVRRGRFAWYPIISILLLLCLGVSSVLAAPTDPFNGATPTVDQRASEPERYQTGDWGVSDQRGAATYTYPIQLPPGRKGMVPTLHLRYSSQSPLRGGLAAGWTLDLPTIRVDRNQGVEENLIYKASLNGVSGRLIQVPDTTPHPTLAAFRVEYDSSYTRFFKWPEDDVTAGQGWLALTSDGVHHYFEDVFGTDIEKRWYLTRQEDPFGNAVHYDWELVNAPTGRDGFLERSLASIEYTANANAGLLPHARITFDYAPLDTCPNSDVPIGGASIGDGMVEGAQRLNNILVEVRENQEATWQLRKRVSLTYDKRSATDLLNPTNPPGDPNDGSDTPIPCDQEGAPLRYLTAIAETAWNQSGEATSLPPVTFSYNRKALNPTQQLPQTVALPGHEQYGTTEGAIGRLLDLDNDGIPDRATVAEENGLCTLRWQKGLPGGGYAATVTRSALPTAPWLDGATPRADLEYCTINGQTAFREYQVMVNGRIITDTAKGFVSYHFQDYTGDGRLDLLTNIWAPLDHTGYLPNGVTKTMSMMPSNEGSPVDPPVDPPLTMSPELRGNRLLWRLYRNADDPASLVPSGDPDARFSEVFAELTSPPVNPKRAFLPSLPPSASDEQIDESQLPSSSIPTMLDIDGDGFLDFIDIGEHPNLLGSQGQWDIYFGTGQLGFSDSAYAWPVPAIQLSRAGRGEETTDDGRGFVHQVVVASLHDINGDRLPDLLVQTADQQLTAYRNNGRSFSDTAIAMGLQSPLEETLTNYTALASGEIIDGTRVYTRRLTDADGDGLVDMLIFPGEDDVVTNRPGVYYNLGDRFQPLQELTESWRLAERSFVAENGSWALRSDLVDSNGDGVSDLVAWSADGMQKTIRHTGYVLPPRLLRQVDNGRGLVIDYDYGSSTDPALVARNSTSIDTQLPSPKWLVATVEIAPGFGTQKMTHHYRYGDPFYQTEHAQDDPREPSTFLGFRTTTMTTETIGDVEPKQIVRTYAYDETGDPSGRLVTEATYRGEEGTFALDSYQTIQWAQYATFGGAVQAAHRIEVVNRTCEAGMSDTACMTQSINLQRVLETWEPHEFDGYKRLYVRTKAQESSGFNDQLGDRWIETRYEIRYGTPTYAADDYRILTARSDQFEAVSNGGGLSFQPRGRLLTIFDAATGLPTQAQHWQNATTIATTLRTYDPATGNLLTQTRPEQVATGGPGTSYSYDAHQLFVAETVNAANHRLMTTHDVATGAQLERKGPNAIVQGGVTYWQQERWTVDGFGRMTAHTVSLDEVANGQPYALSVIMRKHYHDDEAPNRVRVEGLREFGSGQWITTDQRYDGLGRLLTNSQYLADGTAATTSHRYDSAGNRHEIALPDPRVDDGSTVLYRYQHDGLGRVINFTQPDGLLVAITYDGLQRTIAEITSDGSGATTTEINDVFGRLVTVHESNSETGTATTAYSYDMHDRLTVIVDADGNRTEFVHDWLGNRVEVARGERVWRYTYDRNDNLLSKTSPLPAGGDANLYRVAYTYDNLNRITMLTFAEPTIATFPPTNPSDDIGQLLPIDQSYQAYLPLVANTVVARSDAQSGGVAAAHVKTQSTFEPRLQTIRYTYDEETNGIGHLSRVDLPFGSIQYRYDARGLAINEIRTVQLPEAVAPLNVTHSVQRTFNPQQQLVMSLWEDGQQHRIQYDARGMVDRVEWFDPTANTWQVVTDYERALAGAPRTRHAPFANQNRAFTFDVLGRVTADVISANGAVVADRNYDFNQAGDLTTVSGATNGISAAASFTYDQQHRLRTASGPNGYSGTFTYSPAGNVLSANVDWNGAAEAREVTYAYGDVDPQAVDRLIDVTSGKNYGLFTYDLAGNMMTHSTPASQLEMAWDSTDRIRFVQGQNGVELYYYDHTGTRLLAINEQMIRFWFAESETHFDPKGKQIRRYLHLSDTSGTVARVENGTTIEVQYADALQNLLVSLDAAGNEVAAFFYGAFGEVVRASGGTDHRRQFNGKEHDAISGLRYYGFRYYDPVTLRWNSGDPLYRFAPEVGLSDPQRLNLYAFSLNNPVRYYDPDGRNPLLKYVEIGETGVTGMMDLTGALDAGKNLGKAKDAAERGRRGIKPTKTGINAGIANNIQNAAYFGTLSKQQLEQALLILQGKSPQTKRSGSSRANRESRSVLLERAAQLKADIAETQQQQGEVIDEIIETISQPLFDAELKPGPLTEEDQKNFNVQEAYLIELAEESEQLEEKQRAQEAKLRRIDEKLNKQ